MSTWYGKTQISKVKTIFLASLAYFESFCFFSSVLTESHIYLEFVVLSMTQQNHLLSNATNYHGLK